MALLRFFLGSNALLFCNQSCKFTWCDQENCVLLCKFFKINLEKQHLVTVEYQRFLDVVAQWNDILSAVTSQYKECLNRI